MDAPEMTDAPLVSVVTPAFKAERFIAETVASVQAQTMGNWEMLAVDDRSPDGTWQVLQALARDEPRLRPFRNPSNLGPAGSRNVALENARGRFVAFLDSDDLWLPDKLERQLAFMRETGAALTYGAFRRIDETGRRVGRLIEVPERITYAQLLGNTCIATLTVVVDRERAGDFRMPDVGYDDFAAWLSILRRDGRPARGLNEDLARYRVVGGSVSSRPRRSAAWVWDIYRNVEGLGLLRSGWHLANYGYRAWRKRRDF
jgi:teichuronic acid biosynthesis glycosyltransferase TuaG